MSIGTGAMGSQKTESHVSNGSAGDRCYTAVLCFAFRAADRPTRVHALCRPLVPMNSEGTGFCTWTTPIRYSYVMPTSTGKRRAMCNHENLPKYSISNDDVLVAAATEWNDRRLQTLGPRAD